MRRRIAIVATAATLAGVGLTLPAHAHDEPCPEGTVLEVNLHTDINVDGTGDMQDHQICIPPAA